MSIIKPNIVLLLAMIIITSFSCSPYSTNDNKNELIGTWELISSETYINDTIIKEMLDGKKLIKIITNSHFAFLYHDLNKGKDSIIATFVSGGGECSFSDTAYTEHLEYCNYRDWEGLIVNFNVQISNDTLTLKGEESKSDIGVNRYIIEKYVKLGNGR